jgi:SAM-dependent methyltransferase
MPPPPARDRFFALLAPALRDGTLVKLTLGKYRGTDSTVRNLFVRPVALKAGPHLAFLWRHATRDVVKNLPPADALAQLEALVGSDFLDAHLFTATQHAQLETQPDGSARVKIGPVAAAASPVRATHDRAKAHLIPPDAPWLRALGVTNDRGHPREGMADKFRQIQNFAALLRPLLTEAFPAPPAAPLHLVDMGSGKGYLTFALAALLGDQARVTGIEARPDLVALCNRIAADHRLASRLAFRAGTIADTELASVGAPAQSPSPSAPASASALDVLIALHACDTATDDALARGHAAGARLLVVAPCCQKELRPQLAAPPVFADALRHGIFQERHAEFATDALRAQLLEWAGYRTKVFEFISTEHTAKNLMIAAVRTGPTGAPDDARAGRIRAFATFYGIRTQALARHLGFPLA